MTDFDVREQVQLGQPSRWTADAQPGPADVRAPVTGFTGAGQWGLASLLIGCTLLGAACVLLVFNVLLFRGGPAGIPTGLALAGGLIGAVTVSALGLAGLLSGVRGWQQAGADRSCSALPAAGTAASLAGLVAWLIAAIDLIMILWAFNR